MCADLNFLCVDFDLNFSPANVRILFDFQIMATCGRAAKHVKPHYSFPILPPPHTLTHNNPYFHLICVDFFVFSAIFGQNLSHASYCFGDLPISQNINFQMFHEYSPYFMFSLLAVDCWCQFWLWCPGSQPGWCLCREGCKEMSQSVVFASMVPKWVGEPD